MKNWIQTIYRISTTAAAIACIAMISGCVNLKPVEDNTSFYVLSAERDAFEGEISTRVAVRSIDLRDYLKTSQIARLDKGNEITYLSAHRWAGDLDMMIGMVVADELENLSPGTYATVDDTANADLNIDLDVLNFNITSSGNAEVVLEWKIQDHSTREVIAEGRSRASASSTSSDPADQVGALETALRQVVATIADSM